MKFYDATASLLLLTARYTSVDSFVVNNMGNRVQQRLNGREYSKHSGIGCRTTLFASKAPVEMTEPTTTLQSEDQMLHTAERLAGMSRGEIGHIFSDLDEDGNGQLDLFELDMLSKYFHSSCWDHNTKEKLFKEMDVNNDETIDADEFYKWMVLNATCDQESEESQSKTLSTREQRLQLEMESVPKHLLDILDEVGCGAVVQKVTHPLHSAFGRTLLDHFLSCYILAKEWGNSKAVCEAAVFHALYQRGDGMRAVDFEEFRPYLRSKVGEEVEQLVYLFPSTHKSALLEDGLLCAPLGGDISIPNVLEGGYVTVPENLRPALVELEVINSHDQHILENDNPLHNLWLFYQHATVIPIMSNKAQKTIIDYQKRAVGATCADIVEWHEGRFRDANKDIPEVWQKHLDMFRKGGKFSCAEQQLIEMGDKNGDGEIDWEEFTSFDWDSCFLGDSA